MPKGAATSWRVQQPDGEERTRRRSGAVKKDSEGNPKTKIWIIYGVPASLQITQVVCLDCVPNRCCRAEAECMNLRAIAALAMVN